MSALARSFWMSGAMVVMALGVVAALATLMEDRALVRAGSNAAYAPPDAPFSPPSVGKFLP